MIDTGHSIPAQANANAQPCAELNGFVLLAPDDRSRMRRVDFDDAVVTALDAAVKHWLLLIIKVADDTIFAKLFLG